VRDGQKDALPERVWRFDPNRLKPGDVVLERGHAPLSKLITWIDRGDYSHALIWMGGTDFLESVGTGVRVISFARVFVTVPGDWLVLRLPNGEAIAATAAAHARNLAHKSYDVIGIVNTKIPIRRGENPAASICSQVAAASYERAGEVLVPGVPSSKVTPGQLQRNSKLVAVSPTPLEELDLSDPVTAEVVGEFLDRNTAYADSLPHRNMENSQAAFRMIRPMFSGVTAPDGFTGACPPGNLADAIDLLAIMDTSVARPISDRLTVILEDRGYFNLADEGINQTVEQLIMNSAQVPMKLLAVEEVKALVDELRRGEAGRTNSWDRHARNAAICALILRDKDLSIYERHFEMHQRYAMQFMVIANLERKLYEECQQFLAQQSAG
jgi:hypothetical protein